MTLEGLKYVAVMYSVISGDIIKYELMLFKVCHPCCVCN